MITTELRPLAPPQPKTAAWLLPGLLPKGELVLLEGHASVGKSLLAAALAARVSQDDACTLLTASPSSSETLATHLARQEPQYDKLRELCWYADRDGKKDFAANEALNKLQIHIEQHKPPLLLIDSLEESLALLAGEKEHHLREFWSHLVALARQHGTTILVLARPQGRRGSARVARTAAEAAKAVFALAWHPTDSNSRVLTRTRDLTAPAGAQWHLTIDPDGRLDWTEAAPADHVAPASSVNTWNHDTRQRPDLRGAVRAIEAALTGPTPPVVLRDKIMRQGHTLNTYRAAMNLVDARYEKLGSLWVYSPGREMTVLQQLRSHQREEAPAAASSPESSIEPELRRQVDAKLNVASEAFIAEVGAPAAEHLFKTRQPESMRLRYLDFMEAAVAEFSPAERATFEAMNREDDEKEARLAAADPPCCARAHPARS